MKPKDFLSRVLPRGHHYIAWPGDRVGPNGKPIFMHRSFEDPLEGFAQASAKAAERDIYYTPAAFSQAKVYDQVNGYMKSYRKQENVASLRSFYIDVDFKDYGSAREATAAVADFIRDLTIPKPNILVHTGGGFHIYWVVDREVPPADWMVTARCLAGMGQGTGLKADWGVTIDTARILRLPGTTNHKYENKPACRVVQHRDEDISYDTFADHLSAFGPADSLNKSDFKASAEVVQLFPDTNDDLSSGYDAGVTYKASLIVDQCPLLKHTKETGGAGQSYMLWRNVLNLMAYAEEGRERAHELSKGYAGYKPSEVDARFDEALAKKALDQGGPTTCLGFMNAGSAQCATCPFRDQIKSPIVLGREKPRGPQTPEPTYVVGSTTYMNVTVDNETKARVVVDAALEDFKVVREKDGQVYILFTYTLPGQAPDQGSISFVALGTKADTVAGFRAIGLPVNDTNVRLMQMAFESWYNRIIVERKLQKAAPFGWTEDGTGFAVGGELATKEGVSRVKGELTDVERHYAPRGTAAAWKEGANKLLDDERPETHLMVAASFATPLLNFTNTHGLTMAFISTESGRGKTTIMELAQSVWAAPEFAMSSMNDTVNALSQKMARTSFMPSMWDEVRGSQQVIDGFVQLAFRANQGREKQRLSSSAAMVDAARIDTFIICASNYSLKSHFVRTAAGSAAGLMRMLEVGFGEIAMSGATGQEISDARMAVRDNSGHAGREFMRYVLQHKDAMIAKYNQILEGIKKQWSFAPEERFWFESAAIMILAAAIVRSQGIANLDEKRVALGLRKAIEKGRQGTIKVAKELGDVLVTMVNHFSNHILVTDEDGDTAQDVVVMRPPNLDAAKLHVVAMDSKIFIPEATCKEFVKRDPSVTLDQLRDRIKSYKSCKERRGVVGARTNFARAAEEGYELELRDAGLRGLVMGKRV